MEPGSLLSCVLEDWEASHKMKQETPAIYVKKKKKSLIAQMNSWIYILRDFQAGLCLPWSEQKVELVNILMPHPTWMTLWNNV